jgi:carbamoyl-phosphate synthase large subunit
MNRLTRRNGRKSVTVLFSSAGRRVALIECFREDANSLGIALRVVSVDAQPGLSAACSRSDRSYKVARCLEPEFIPEFCRICESEEVDLVIPTIDTELEVLSRLRHSLAQLGTRVAVSGMEVVQLARNKAETMRVLSENGIPSIRTLPLVELRQAPERLRWPVILKPNQGSSSIGLRILSEPRELVDFSDAQASYIAQEFWRGSEFTVNLYFDSMSRIRCAIPHLRYEVRAGEVSKAMTRRQPALEAIAWKLGPLLVGAYGPLCFQAIVQTNGECGIFELNARFGGGYPLAHRAGARFSRWLLEDVVGATSSAANDWDDHLTMLRYDAAVFIEGGAAS